jgi:phage terminase small subunit
MTLKNARHEKFARLVADGAQKGEAYKKVFPGARKWKRQSVWVKSCCLSKRPEVAERIKELQTIEADKTIASKTELAQFMTRIVRTPIGEVNEDSDLAQEKTTRTIPGKEDDTVVEKIRMPDKLGAAERLSKLMGYDEPEKSESTVKFTPDAAVREKLGK